MRPPPSQAWARASRELGPLLPGPATCSPAGTARCTSFSCSASPGLSRRAGPSAAACSLPAPGPARRPPVEVPPGPGAVRSAPAAPHGVLAPPVGSRSQGPSARPSEPPGLCASVRDPTATPARPQARRANVSPAPRRPAPPGFLDGLAPGVSPAQVPPPQWPAPPRGAAALARGPRPVLRLSIYKVVVEAAGR